MECKNCGNDIVGNFCSYCGQKSTISRIKLSNFISEISESFFQINKGFFYTLKELSVRPGKSIIEFLNGKRKRHFKPIAYLLTMSTLYFFATQITNQNTFMGDIIEGWSAGRTENTVNEEFTKITNWFLKNYAYSILLLIPLFSLASFITFFKHRKTYLEHIVINSYVTGHQAIFYTLAIFFKNAFNNVVIEFLAITFIVAYNFWVFWQVFSEGNRNINILKSIMTYLLYLVFVSVFLGALSVVTKL